MAISKTIGVDSCEECPFFIQTTLSIIASLFNGPDNEVMRGECDAPYTSGLKHFVMGAQSTAEIERRRSQQGKRLRVLDASEMPDQCPLRQVDIVVTKAGS